MYCHSSWKKYSNLIFFFQSLSIKKNEKITIGPHINNPITFQYFMYKRTIFIWLGIELSNKAFKLCAFDELTPIFRKTMSVLSIFYLFISNVSNDTTLDKDK